MGPWQGEWPDGEHWDPELLRTGDRRNVAEADAVLAIEPFGSTRSINAGAAAAVTMHAWIRRHVFEQRPAPSSDVRKGAGA